MSTKGLRTGRRSTAGARKPGKRAGSCVCAICKRHCYPYQAAASTRGVPCDKDCKPSEGETR